MSKHIAGLVPAVALLLSVGACREPLRPVAAPIHPSLATTEVPPTPPWSRIVDGETGPGSSYRLYMPAVWNGNLVVYAHGVIAPFAPVALPAEGDSIARLFGLKGYAVALSSFSENGIAMKDGVQRTHQLRGLFAAQFGTPARTYLSGRSMGGFIVTALAERFPRQYDGVLPICGVVGGFPAELDYVFNARALFDVFFPGALPGSLSAVPMPSDPAAGFAAAVALQNAAVGALLSDTRFPPASVLIALVDQTSMPLPAALGGPLTNAQFGTFIVSPVVLHGIFVNDILNHTHGHMPFDNMATVYTSSSGIPWMMPVLAAINANVTRVAATPDAVAWMAHNGDTSGQLTIPMLTLHTRYDTWVPIATEAIYRAKVATAGDSNLLVQRTTEGFDHCNFTPAELTKGITDLASWVEQGVKPAP